MSEPGRKNLHLACLLLCRKGCLIKHIQTSRLVAHMLFHLIGLYEDTGCEKFLAEIPVVYLYSER